eukprot:746944-Hanusia_phi.AAC.1
MATEASPELLREALVKLMGEEEGKQAEIEPTSGGANNVVRYVHVKGETFVLRLYNNGNATRNVHFEHELLKQLNLQAPHLTFQVPSYLKCVNSDNTYVILSTGAAACMCHVIPGKLPKTTSPEILGRAAGELLTALADIKVDLTAPTPPYHQLWDVHSAITPEVYSSVVSKQEFDFIREPINILTAELRRLEKKIEDMLALGLPKQLIHGDLHYDNCLIQDERGIEEVTGILDFEFAAFDWRAMELAVCLSKYAAEDEPLKLMETFFSGFVVHGKVTEQEVDVIPDLINMRIISNVLFFIGRAEAKEDKIEAFSKRAKMYADRISWINTNGDAMRATLKKYLA